MAAASELESKSVPQRPGGEQVTPRTSSDANTDDEQRVLPWEGEKGAAISWLVEATIGALNRHPSAGPLRLQASWKGAGSQDEFQQQVARALSEEVWPRVVLDSQLGEPRDDEVRVQVVSGLRGNIFAIVVAPLSFGSVAIHVKTSKLKVRSAAGKVDGSLLLWRDALRSASIDWRKALFEPCVAVVDELQAPLRAGSEVREEDARNEDKLLRRHLWNDPERLARRVSEFAPPLLRSAGGASQFFLGVADGGVVIGEPLTVPFGPEFCESLVDRMDSELKTRLFPPLPPRSLVVSFHPVDTDLPDRAPDGVSTVEVITNSVRTELFERRGRAEVACPQTSSRECELDAHLLALDRSVPGRESRYVCSVQANPAHGFPRAALVESAGICSFLIAPDLSIRRLHLFDIWGRLTADTQFTVQDWLSNPLVARVWVSVEDERREFLLPGVDIVDHFKVPREDLPQLQRAKDSRRFIQDAKYRSKLYGAVLYVIDAEHLNAHAIENVREHLLALLMASASPEGRFDVEPAHFALVLWRQDAPDLSRLRALRELRDLDIVGVVSCLWPPLPGARGGVKPLLPAGVVDVGQVLRPSPEVIRRQSQRSWVVNGGVNNVGEIMQLSADSQGCLPVTRVQAMLIVSQIQALLEAQRKAEVDAWPEVLALLKAFRGIGASALLACVGRLLRERNIARVLTWTRQGIDAESAQQFWKSIVPKEPLVVLLDENASDCFSVSALVRSCPTGASTPAVILVVRPTRNADRTARPLLVSPFLDDSEAKLMRDALTRLFPLRGRELDAACNTASRSQSSSPMRHMFNFVFAAVVGASQPVAQCVTEVWARIDRADRHHLVILSFLRVFADHAPGTRSLTRNVSVRVSLPPVLIGTFCVIDGEDAVTRVPAPRVWHRVLAFYIIAQASREGPPIKDVLLDALRSAAALVYGSTIDDKQVSIVSDFLRHLLVTRVGRGSLRSRFSPLVESLLALCGNSGQTTASLLDGLQSKLLEATRGHSSIRDLFDVHVRIVRARLAALDFVVGGDENAINVAIALARDAAEAHADTATAKHVLATMLLRRALAFRDMRNLREAHALFKELNPHHYGVVRENTTAEDVRRKLQVALGNRGWKAQDRSELEQIAMFWKTEAAKQQRKDKSYDDEKSSGMQDDWTPDQEIDEEEQALSLRLAKSTIEERDDQWSLKSEWDAFVEW